jgi:hypothetical protein
LVEQAWLVIPGESLTGTATTPTLAHTAQALAAGVLGADHVAAIAAIMAALPGWLDTAARQDIEATLAETAHSTDATVIRKLGSKILARLDQDGPQPSDDQPSRGNQLRTRTRRDGRMSFTGEIDPQAAALFTELLGPLAKPVPADPEGRDPRDAPERMGDAFVDILALAAGNGDVPTQGGQKPTVVVTVPLEVLETELGYALLDAGGVIGATHARMMACDCKVVPMVLGSKSEPLDIGRADRTVPLAMRRALVHRDRGCAFPGCDRPATWCHSHHVKHWAQGGDTALNNLVLACTTHHRLLHFSEWEVAIVNGKSEFYPPAFLDPERKPLRNQLHQTLGGVLAGRRS